MGVYSNLQASTNLVARRASQSPRMALRQNHEPPPIYSRSPRSSALIILGLIAEVSSPLWFHPLAFVVFVFLAAAAPLVGMGMLNSSVFCRLRCGPPRRTL